MPKNEPHRSLITALTFSYNYFIGFNFQAFITCVFKEHKPNYTHCYAIH